MRLRVVMVLALIGALAVPTAAAANPPAAQGRAGRYIVTLREGEDPPRVAADYRRAGAAVDFVYTAALPGFAGTLSPAHLARLEADDRVARVERDGRVWAVETVQTGATWGLDRTDQRDLPLDASYRYDVAGAAVTAYIIDTGIRPTHADLGGRVTAGATSIADRYGTNDCNGHGTHVAGTVGGTLYGMAKAVSLTPVRVLDCNGSGTWSGVIAGVDWVTAHATGPSVANMSLGGGANSSVDDAIRRSIASGVVYVVAAGNSYADACAYSPARVTQALTVGATDRYDARPAWSNFGTCVDLFAPGVGITSAWHTSDTATNTISGTSMASPHVAGAAALALSRGTAAADVDDVLLAAATTGKVTGAGSGSPNRLLHNGASATAPTNGAPTATITSKGCSGTACTFTGSGTDPDGDAVALAWSLGNGTTATGATASTTYVAAGTYVVVLTATDPDGASGTASATVSCSVSKGKNKTLGCKAP